ncbi:MAG TPA: phosphoglycerate mutase family protein [Acidimicrobiales bacterium]|nr:phosphoglycerate mutase family protein [Acidimicrobiales bacterium]
MLLVRHAEAGDRHRWDGRDEDRPLSEEGRAQAEALTDVLAGYEIARILSSPYLRCTQTVEPLAAARGLPAEPSDDLAEGAGRVALMRVRSLLEAQGDTVLCTHGDVVEEVLDGLGVRRSDETAKGATWVLGPGQARRLPPPA